MNKHQINGIRFTAGEWAALSHRLDEPSALYDVFDEYAADEPDQIEPDAIDDAIDEIRSGVASSEAARRVLVDAIEGSTWIGDAHLVLSQQGYTAAVATFERAAGKVETIVGREIGRPSWPTRW